MHSESMFSHASLAVLCYCGANIANSYTSKAVYIAGNISSLTSSFTWQARSLSPFPFPLWSSFYFSLLNIIRTEKKWRGNSQQREIKWTPGSLYLYQLKSLLWIPCGILFSFCFAFSRKCYAKINAGHQWRCCSVPLCPLLLHMQDTFLENLVFHFSFHKPGSTGFLDLFKGTAQMKDLLFVHFCK